MNEMVERVAKAMADAVAMNYDHNEAIFKLYARAAIEAMREPTDAMAEQIGLAFAVLVAAGRISSAEDLSDSAEKLFWQVAIDEALK
jgi:hypothetical protein